VAGHRVFLAFMGVLVFLVMGAMTTARAQVPTTQAVISAAREALGGEQRLSAVTSFTATGRTRQLRGNNLVPIEFEIAIDCPEFTSVCPKTGLPDFGEIRITYVPGDRCIELKSLKYYMIEFRNRGIFYEAVTNQILDDLVAACQPRRMTVVGDFSVRGGIKTVVTATYNAP